MVRCRGTPHIRSRFWTRIRRWWGLLRREDLSMSSYFWYFSDIGASANDSGNSFMPLDKTTPPEPTRPTPPRRVTVPPAAALTPAPSPTCRDSTYTHSWTLTPVGTLSMVPPPSASGTNPPTSWALPESHTLSQTTTAPSISTASTGHTRSCNRCARRPSRRMSTLPCLLS